MRSLRCPASDSLATFADCGVLLFIEAELEHTVEPRLVRELKSAQGNL